jgi:hypothetical protein
MFFRDMEVIEEEEELDEVGIQNVNAASSEWQQVTRGDRGSGGRQRGLRSVGGRDPYHAPVPPHYLRSGEIVFRAVIDGVLGGVLLDSNDSDSLASLSERGEGEGDDVMSRDALSRDAREPLTWPRTVRSRNSHVSLL